MTSIELGVILYKIYDIQSLLKAAEEIGLMPNYLPFNPLEKFLFKIYQNYKGMIYVLIIILLLLNLIASTIIYVIYELIINHIIPLI